MKKRLIKLILATAMAILLLPAIIYAQTSGICGDDLTWVLDDYGVLTIRGTGKMQNWGADMAPWYENRSFVKEVVLNEGVETVGEWAFYLCDNLTKVTLPDSIKRIGVKAFLGCTNLSDITIPDGVTFIGDQAFQGCHEVANIIIPDSVTRIGRYAFFDCRSLTSIKIPDGIEFITEQMFSLCADLEDVTIPDSATQIGLGAFSSCSNLQGVTIPEGVTWIYDWAFSDCNSLTSITIPKSVTRIEKNAFLNCDNLVDVYYGGSSDEWKSIFVDSGNKCLTHANIHYNSVPGYKYEILGHRIENGSLVIKAFAENNNDSTLNFVSMIGLYDGNGALKSVVPDLSAIPKHDSGLIEFKLENYKYEYGDRIKLFVVFPEWEAQSEILVSE